jgi:kynurenine 3-monooxygenase
MFLSARSSSRAAAAMSTTSTATDAPVPKPAGGGLVATLLRRRRSSPASAATAAIVAQRRGQRPVSPPRSASTTTTTTTTSTTTTTAATPKTTTTTSILPPGLPSAPGRAVVVGAGPSGVLCAIALARRGFSVDVFERRGQGEGSDPRRTFGIVLGERALKSLESVGVDVKPLRRGRRMLGSVVATQQGMLSEDFFADPAADDEDDVVEAAIESTSGNNGSNNNTNKNKKRRRPAGRLMVVERAAVVAHLLAEAERLCPSSTGALRFHWSRPLSAVDFGAKVASFGSSATNSPSSSSPTDVVQVPFDLLVGADGASSAVRSQLESQNLISVSRLPSPASSMEYVGFSRLTDEESDGAFFVPPPSSVSGGSFFYTFLGARSMDGSKSGGAPYAGSVALYRRPDLPHGKGPQGWSGIVALPPGKFDALLGQGEEAYSAALDALLPPAGEGAESCANLRAFPARWRSEIVRQLAAANEPGTIGRLTPLAAASSLALPEKGVVLLGDAASSNTPQMGQGAGSALEDAALLAGRLDEQVGKVLGSGGVGGSSSSSSSSSSAAAAVLLGKESGKEEQAAAASSSPLPLTSALAAYASSRQPQRRALQAMERELAVFRRPPAAEQEPLEDQRARRAWRAFMAQQKVVGQVARVAAAVAGWVALALAPLAALLGGGGTAQSNVATPGAIAARMNQWSGWTQLLHSGVPYDRLLARIHAAPTMNAALLAAAVGVAVAVAAAVFRALVLGGAA